MSTTDTAASAAGTPRPAASGGWCSWHEAYSRTARLVRIFEAGSASASGLFACAPCRHAYDLTPITEQKP